MQEGILFTVTLASRLGRVSGVGVEVIEGIDTNYFLFVSHELEAAAKRGAGCCGGDPMEGNATCRSQPDEAHSESVLTCFDLRVILCLVAAQSDTKPNEYDKT